MKYTYLLFVALAFAGCSGNKVEITGTVSGVSDATISLKDGSGQVLTAVNAKDGKFTLESSGWSNPDYGTLTLSRPGKDEVNTELYLEPGNYTVTYNKDALSTYPKVGSTSVTQNQLSAFHEIYERVTFDAAQKIKTLDAKYQEDRKSRKWDDSLTALTNKTEKERAKLEDVGLAAFTGFMAKYPNNKIGIHALMALNYEGDPETYYALFKKLPADQQNSEDGKAIGVRLNALVHLVAGQPAPQIVGLTPEGKKFELKAMHKKLILVECWRAANYQSRLNHQVMINKPWEAYTDGDLGIVSISFDKKRDWWLGSMRDDKLTWPQVSDLKGTDSPNFDNWAITSFPVYYLLDGDGRILEPNLQFSEIPIVVKKHLKNS